eukprot:COSAG02_NODE_7183_length_3134_cov_4.238221_1_plen_77_part_00
MVERGRALPTPGRRGGYGTRSPRAQRSWVRGREPTGSVAGGWVAGRARASGGRSTFTATVLGSLHERNEAVLHVGR